MTHAASFGRHADAVIGISCAVLVALYAFQRLGTSRLGILFAPVILLWFAAIFCVGIYNIVTWYPGVQLSCMSPLFPSLEMHSSPLHGDKSFWPSCSPSPLLSTMPCPKV
jgi:K+ transporter